MEYNNIISLVPTNEHFDASAIGEGVWLSTGHLDSVESALGSVAATNATLSTAQAMIAEKETAITNAQSTIVERDATIATQTTRIQELEAQVKELGAKPSGTGSATAVITDPVETTPNTGAVRFDSPEHPANAYADQLTGSKILRSI